jgi:hypothetical protein
MSDHDLLLAYLSEKGSGSWTGLKGAWEWVTEPTDDPGDQAWLVARDLAALGHIELSWGETAMWCAAPPLLTMLPRSGGRALVTGSRTRWLYEPGNGEEPAAGALVQSAEELGLWLDECPAPDGPTTLLVACKRERNARQLAEKLGIAYTYEVADQLSELLPPLGEYARLWPDGALPRGFDAEAFDPLTCKWLPVDEPSDHGLYRCRTYQGHVHALHGPTGWRRVVRELGVYEVLRWEKMEVLYYDAPQLELTVRVGAALPALHARAATLCSGRLPSFSREHGGELTYWNVPQDVAERIASSLSQTLHIVVA